MQNYIDIFQKESERHAAYPEQRTANFENIANITIDSDILIPQQKQNLNEKNCQANPYEENQAKIILKKMRVK